MEADAKTESSNKLLFGVFLVLIVLASALHLSMSVNHDAAWLLHGTRNLVAGGAFGETVIDVNPPLAWWIAAPAVAIQKLTGVKLGLAFKLFVLLLVGASAWISERILASRFVNKGSAIEGLTKYLLAAICLLIAGYDFGQREYFMAVLAMPYVVLTGCRWRELHRNSVEDGVQEVGVKNQFGVALVLLASFPGAIGFCIKPHFLAIPIALELWLLVKSRNVLNFLRIETLTIVVVGAVYLICVWVFAPNWLLEILPQAMTSYGAYSSPLSNVAIQYGKSLLAPGAAVLLMFLLWQSRIRPISTAFFVAGIGAAIAAIVQSKGWSYHILPAALLWSVAGGLELLGAIDAFRSQQKSDKSSPAIPVFAGTMLILYCVLVPCINLMQDRLSDQGNEGRVNDLTELIDAQPDSDRSVFAFNTSPRVIHSAVIDSKGHWIGKACCLHFLPAMVRNPADDRLKEVAMEQMDEVMQMLEQSPCQVLVVDEGAGKLAFANVRFDYLKWFRENYPQRFEAFIANYEQQESIGYFAVFCRK